jgi:hypothetical protein
LEIARIEDHEGPAHLADWLWTGSGPDLGLWALPGGGGRISRSWVEAGPPRRRLLCHYEPGQPLRALDRVEFLLGEGRFAEVGRYLRREGQNQHARVIELPAVLSPGVWHRPIEGSASRVRLAWKGRLRLTVEGQPPEEHEGICLDAEEGPRQVTSYLLRGIGEVAYGREEGLDRWLVGWVGGEQRLFGGVDPALLAQVFPGLPEGPSPEDPAARLL